eukprot:GHVL01004713.1.p1 GENE.GHVL01004713.1~~GHVL01004713.1.p1  ORF type:complete len:814 (-),score=83.20 GHVL01004713.1:86-2527(-)
MDSSHNIVTNNPSSAELKMQLISAQNRSTVSSQRHFRRLSANLAAPQSATVSRHRDGALGQSALESIDSELRATIGLSHVNRPRPSSLAPVSTKTADDAASIFGISFENCHALKASNNSKKNLSAWDLNVDVTPNKCRASNRPLSENILRKSSSLTWGALLKSQLLHIQENSLHVNASPLKQFSATSALNIVTSNQPLLTKDRSSIVQVNSEIIPCQNLLRQQAKNPQVENFSSNFEEFEMSSNKNIVSPQVEVALTVMHKLMQESAVSRLFCVLQRFLYLQVMRALIDIYRVKYKKDIALYEEEIFISRIQHCSNRKQQSIEYSLIVQKKCQMGGCRMIAKTLTDVTAQHKKTFMRYLQFDLNDSKNSSKNKVKQLSETLASIFSRRNDSSIEHWSPDQLSILEAFRFWRHLARLYGTLNRALNIVRQSAFSHWLSFIDSRQLVKMETHSNEQWLFTRSSKKRSRQLRYINQWRRLYHYNLSLTKFLLAANKIVVKIKKSTFKWLTVVLCKELRQDDPRIQIAMRVASNKFMEWSKRFGSFSGCLCLVSSLRSASSRIMLSSLFTMRQITQCKNRVEVSFDEQGTPRGGFTSRVRFDGKSSTNPAKSSTNPAKFRLNSFDCGDTSSRFNSASSLFKCQESDSKTKLKSFNLSNNQSSATSITESGEPLPQLPKPPTPPREPNPPTGRAKSAAPRRSISATTNSTDSNKWTSTTTENVHSEVVPYFASASRPTHKEHATDPSWVKTASYPQDEPSPTSDISQPSIQWAQNTESHLSIHWANSATDSVASLLEPIKSVQVSSPPPRSSKTVKQK